MQLERGSRLIFLSKTDKFQQRSWHEHHSASGTEHKTPRCCDRQHGYWQGFAFCSKVKSYHSFKMSQLVLFMAHFYSTRLEVRPQEFGVDLEMAHKGQRAESLLGRRALPHAPLANLITHKHALTNRKLKKWGKNYRLNLSIVACISWRSSLTAFRAFIRYNYKQ